MSCSVSLPFVFASLLLASACTGPDWTWKPVPEKYSASQGQVTVVAGGLTSGDEDGPALSGRLNTPIGVAAGADGSLYVADSGNALIRKVTADGRLTTLAGKRRNPNDTTTTAVSNQNPPPAPPATTLVLPQAVALDLQGNLLLTDAQQRRIVRLAPDGSMMVLATLTTTGYLSLTSVAVDRSGTDTPSTGTTTGSSGSSRTVQW